MPPAETAAAVRSQTARQADPPESAPHELERELAAVEGGRAWVRRLAWLVGIVALVGAGVGYRIKTRPPPPSKYVTAALTEGDVAETVQSTGAVQPLTQVQVGAQVSGRIAKVFVDFNSVVKQGDVLAEIDPTLFGATVEQNRAQAAAAQAQVGRAEAALAAAQVALDRAEKLRAENLSSQADVDQARGQRDVAQSEVAAAKATIIQTRAALSFARTNLAYTRIYAPIDGVVVSRNIDPGQTVAASFQAPVLFVIAQDLRKMRVLADVDEADVGKLKEGMIADATVDAFPGENFRGQVIQVRYNPNTVQGVVTYSAVIDVDNEDGKLRPGMTATVTVKTREAKGVVRVANSALRFRPSPPLGADGKPQPTPPEPPLGKGKGRVWLVSDPTPGKEKVEPKIVEVGITDGVTTELKEGLAKDAKVVVDEVDSGDKKKGMRVF